MLAIVGATATAGAEGAAPAPCEGATVINDPAGDAVQTGAAPGAAAPGNVDVRSVFLNAETIDGKPRYTANIVVANLDKTASPSPLHDSTQWEVEINTTTDKFRLIANLKGGVFTYKKRFAKCPKPKKKKAARR